VIVASTGAMSTRRMRCWAICLTKARRDRRQKTRTRLTKRERARMLVGIQEDQAGELGLRTAY